jgi:hypothetical protein
MRVIILAIARLESVLPNILSRVERSRWERSVAEFNAAAEKWKPAEAAKDIFVMVE